MTASARMTILVECQLN